LSGSDSTGCRTCDWQFGNMVRQQVSGI
jgi:hypothetical protein